MKSLPFGVLMLLSLLVSAAVSFGITPIVKRVAYKVGAVDVPKDERRMHSVPIPRLGGLAIAIAFLLTVVLFAQVGEQMQGILLGAVVILVLGVLDDCLTLRAWFKFLVQIFAAYLVTSHGCTIRYFTNPIVTSSVQYLGQNGLQLVHRLHKARELLQQLLGILWAEAQLGNLLSQRNKLAVSGLQIDEPIFIDVHHAFSVSSLPLSGLAPQRKKRSIKRCKHVC